MIDKSGFYGIYGIWHVPFWQTMTFYISIGLISASFLIFFIWLFVKKRRAKKMVITAWDEALRLLNAINIHELEKNHGKEFYFTVTKILKEYFHARYGFDVLGKTDAEVLQYLMHHDFSHELLPLLQHIFSGAVEVKFAHAYALKEQLERDLNSSIYIVKSSIPTVKKDNIQA